MCIQANWIQNQIFRSYSRIRVAFFFLQNISLAVAFQIRMYIFLLPFLRKKPFSVRFLEEKKKETSKKMEILKHLHISFSFFSFLINVSIFYMVVLKEKFFSFKRDLSLLKKFGGLEYKKD